MIGLGLSITQRAVLQMLGFSPNSLFSAGEQGAWYDPSDRSTMFQDAAGTTPVTAVEQPVGRILDKSGRGNHATQTTSTSRPVLSARVNLLTKTEQFDDAAWAKTNVTVTPNAAVAPDGTLTADKLVENTSGGLHGFYSGGGVVLPSTTTYSVSFRVKPNGRNYCLVYSSQGGVGRYFSLLGAGEVLGNYSANAVPGAIQSLEDGWYLCTITPTSLGSAATAEIYASIDGLTAGYTGDGTSGIYIWGASLVPANQSSLPYQRVNTSTDYDADPSKFKPYLRFDGVDDWLVTPTITPGTDKAQVFAGVRKVAVATTQMIVELSADLNTNNGSIYLLVSNVTDRGYAFSSKGTVSPTPAFYSPTTPSTETAVITAIGSISEDYIALRRNGVDATPSTSDQGTGNFGNYPLYIGRRGGTTLPFNGHLYSLIVRFGANLPAGTIASTETWLNQRTGAY